MTVGQFRVSATELTVLACAASFFHGVMTGFLEVPASGSFYFEVFFP